MEKSECKTRIHTLTSGYRAYLDSKRNTTRIAPSKKPPCFDKLDAILNDKPSTMLHFWSSSSGVTNERSEEPDIFDSENLVTFYIDVTGEILNSFTTTQAQDGKEFFNKLFGEKSTVESGDDNTIVIKVPNSGEPFSLR